MGLLPFLLFFDLNGKKFYMNQFGMLVKKLFKQYNSCSGDFSSRQNFWSMTNQRPAVWIAESLNTDQAVWSSWCLVSVALLSAEL